MKTLGEQEYWAERRGLRKTQRRTLKAGLAMIQNEHDYVKAFRQMRDCEREGRKAASLADKLYDEQMKHVFGMEAKRCTDIADVIRRCLEEYDAAHCKDRKGRWMLTHSGRRFWLLDPRPEEIDVGDVAQGLSRLARYYGGTKGDVGFSVAQHSVLCSRIVPPENALYALLHDAAEAYVGDMASPLKAIVGKAYTDIEDRIMDAVAARFGLRRTDEDRRRVKWADRTLLATEVRDLVPQQCLYEEPDEVPLRDTLTPWEPFVAKVMFLHRFGELTRGEGR